MKLERVASSLLLAVLALGGCSTHSSVKPLPATRYGQHKPSEPMPQTASMSPAPRLDESEKNNEDSLREQPTIDISEHEIQKLCVVTRFWTNSRLRIWKVLRVPVRSSGNGAFDESVRKALDSAIEERAPIPEPQAIPVRRNVRNAAVTLAFSIGQHVDCSADAPFSGRKGN